MECKPFNIDVMLVLPGSVKSNLSNNQASLYTFPPNSLYAGYLDNIIARIHASQGRNSMATDEFAKQVVRKALGGSPPSHIRLGGNVLLFSILKWIPRAWTLWFMWKIHSKRRCVLAFVPIVD
jgi:short-subunit dehydrogenase